MYETIDVRVPDIGDFKDVPVIEVLVKPGDTVKAEDPLVTLESDKATMDVPSPAAGTVKEVKVKVGDKVSRRAALILTLSTGVQGCGARRASPRRRRIAAARRPRRAGGRVPMPAAPTSSARCWCWAPGPAAIRRRSAPPTSA